MSWERKQTISASTSPFPAISLQGNFARCRVLAPWLLRCYCRRVVKWNLANVPHCGVHFKNAGFLTTAGSCQSPIISQYTTKETEPCPGILQDHAAATNSQGGSGAPSAASACPACAGCCWHTAWPLASDTRPPCLLSRMCACAPITATRMW